MAPAVKVTQSGRTTRSSTRSQTHKSQNDNSSTGPLKAQNTGKIDKKSRKATKKAQEKGPRRTVKSKPNPDANNEPPAQSQHASSSPPPSPTTFTIASDLVSKPILCHQYGPITQKKTPPNRTPFIFTHGAGGTLAAPAVVNFCTGFQSTTPLVAFQGSSNLSARVKGFHACRAYLGSGDEDVVFGGRSMGARAAAMAAMEIIAGAQGRLDGRVRVVLVSYPLQGPRDVRDRVLVDLPRETDVLFVVGDRDAMCPLDLLEEVRGRMEASSKLVVVRGADHGMNVRPASKTQQLGEETGRVAARWITRCVVSGDDTLFIGDGDE